MTGNFGMSTRPMYEAATVRTAGDCLPVEGQQPAWLALPPPAAAAPGPSPPPPGMLHQQLPCPSQQWLPPHLLPQLPPPAAQHHVTGARKRARGRIGGFRPIVSAILHLDVWQLLQCPFAAVVLSVHVSHIRTQYCSRKRISAPLMCRGFTCG